jgi:hypothetical protein
LHEWDTDVPLDPDSLAKLRNDGYAEFGLDLSIPIITSKVIGFDIYGQYGMGIDPKDDDTVKNDGWGIGAPGVALRVGPAWGRLEYRHTGGRFTPGHFGYYYGDERVAKYPTSDTTHVILSKEDLLVEEDLNGVYGVLGLNIGNAITVSGTYQYLMGEAASPGGDDPTDHRFEARAALGDLIVKKIPKVTKAEAYIEKTNIMRNENPVTHENDRFFTPTPTMYWGYRLGFEIVKGAGLVWDARYTFRYDLDDPKGKSKQIVDNMGIQASLTF